MFPESSAPPVNTARLLQLKQSDDTVMATTSGSEAALRRNWRRHFCFGGLPCMYGVLKGKNGHKNMAQTVDMSGAGRAIAGADPDL